MCVESPAGTLDVTFREDLSRVRKDHGPQNLAVLRQIALNLLKKETTLKRGIQGKRLKSGWVEDYLLKGLRRDCPGWHWPSRAVLPRRGDDCRRRLLVYTGDVVLEGRVGGGRPGPGPLGEGDAHADDHDVLSLLDAPVRLDGQLPAEPYPPLGAVD